VTLSRASPSYPIPVTPGNRPFAYAASISEQSVVVFPVFFAVPATMFELMVGEFAQIVLSSQKIAPRVATETGYRFMHPEIGPILEK
jgi:NAD dependent epimerase/dehydratase family enzyme